MMQVSHSLYLSYQLCIAQRNTKKTRATCQTLQGSLSKLNAEDDMTAQLEED